MPFGGTNSPGPAGPAGPIGPAGPAGAPGTPGNIVSVLDEGAVVLASPSNLNFVGSGVTVTDGGGGSATVTIPGAAAPTGSVSAIKRTSSVNQVAPGGVTPVNTTLAFDTTEFVFGTFPTTTTQITVTDPGVYLLYGFVSFNEATTHPAQKALQFVVNGVALPVDSGGIITVQPVAVSTFGNSCDVEALFTLAASDVVTLELRNNAPLGSDVTLTSAVLSLVKQGGAQGAIGPAGAAGAPGTNGTNGTNGNVISVSDEGVVVLPLPTDINFAGPGVTVGNDGDGTVTVTIPGAGTPGQSLQDCLGATLATGAQVVTCAQHTADLALKAPLASPVFTGDPQVPTAAPGDNDNSAASTAFVATAVSGKLDAPTVSTPARVLNTNFQPSATRPVFVSYSIQIVAASTLITPQTGTCQLISDAVAVPTTSRARVTNGLSGVLATGTQAAQLSYIVPAGHFVRLATSGAATITITDQLEEVL